VRADGHDRALIDPRRSPQSSYGRHRPPASDDRHRPEGIEQHSVTNTTVGARRLPQSRQDCRPHLDLRSAEHRQAL